MPDMAVELFLDGSVGEVVLNRPDKLNAIDRAMAAELAEQLDSAEKASVRALVIRGEGKAFCAGRDLAEVDPAGEDARAVVEEVFNDLVRRVMAFPAPTFAAVHGACVGGGLGIALACDIIYVADDARLGSPFARLGAVLDSGGHAFFVERLGPHRALELIYTGRLMSGREAEAWGLVNRSVGRMVLLDRVRALASLVAQGPTAALLESKQLVRRIREECLSFSQILAAEADAQGRASKTSDYREGVAAFKEKRTAQFVGR